MATTDSPKFHKKVGKFIPAFEATRMQERYMGSKRCANELEPSKSVFFGIDMINELLKKPNTEGLRIYFSENDEGKLTVVLTAADLTGKPIEPNKGALKDGGEDDNSYLDSGVICPKVCP